MALLFLLKNGRFHITHINVAEPERPYNPPTDFDAGFEVNLSKYGRSILAPELAALRSEIFRKIYVIDPEAFLDATLPAAHKVWAGEKAILTLSDLKHALETAEIKEKTRTQFLEAFEKVESVG